MGKIVVVWWYIQVIFVLFCINATNVIGEDGNEDPIVGTTVGTLVTCENEGNDECKKQSRVCSNYLEGGYSCGECVLNYKNETDNPNCVPVTCGNEGDSHCKGLNRVCYNKPEAGFGCGDCFENYWNETDKGECLPETCGNKGDSRCATLKRVCYNKPVAGFGCGDCIADYKNETDKEECVPGHQEHICNTEEDPCGDNGVCKEDGNNYICICDIGYSGKHCEDIEWCENNNKLCGEEICKFDDSTKFGYCYCGSNSSIYFDVAEHKCKAIDICLLKKAKGECTKPHQICVEGNCKCEKNYKQNGTSCVADFCGSRNPCGLYSTCIEVGDGTYQCQCDVGYTWNGKSCKKSNFCSPGITDCGQKCKDGICSCYEGFHLDQDNKTCKLDSGKELCIKNCGAGKCFGDKCLCPEVSHVLFNETCIDRCTAGKLMENTCPPGVGCLANKKYGFICNCNGIYKTAKDGIHCDRKNMCTEGHGAEECKKKNAECRDDVKPSEEYTCFCRDGYQFEENVCTHKCLLKHQVKKCLNDLGTCELDANYNAVCKCGPLLEKDTSGKCNHLAKHSFTGAFLVQRNTYEISKADGGRVKRSINSIDYIKLKGDIIESLKKVYTTDYADSNILNCRNAGNDLNCTVELQLKKEAKEKLSIITSRTVCLPIEGNPGHCLILPNLIVRKTKIVFKETDPCNEDVRNKVCGSATKCATVEEMNFKCTCDNGFKSIGFYNPVTDKRTLIENCEDINECRNSSACPNTADCFNLHGSYLCSCKDGFRRKDDGSDPKTEGCIAVCDPNPCVHGSCHQTGQNGFACDCEGSYTGIICNETNVHVTGAKEKGHKIASIVGGVLGAALGVIIIIGLIIFRKMQKKKLENDLEEYARRRNQGILSNIGQARFGRNDENQSRDVEVHALDQRGSGDYRREYRESHISIPRPQVGGGRPRPEKSDTGDNRRGHADDDRQRQTRSSLFKSSDGPIGQERMSNVMQYKNRGFEED